MLLALISSHSYIDSGLQFFDYFIVLVNSVSFNYDGMINESPQIWKTFCED